MKNRHFAFLALISLIGNLAFPVSLVLGQDACRPDRLAPHLVLDSLQKDFQLRLGQSVSGLDSLGFAPDIQYSRLIEQHKIFYGTRLWLALKKVNKNLLPLVRLAMPRLSARGTLALLRSLYTEDENLSPQGLGGLRLLALEAETGQLKNYKPETLGRAVAEAGNNAVFLLRCLQKEQTRFSDTDIRVLNAYFKDMELMLSFDAGWNQHEILPLLSGAGREARLRFLAFYYGLSEKARGPVNRILAEGTDSGWFQEIVRLFDRSPRFAPLFCALAALRPDSEVLDLPPNPAPEQVIKVLDEARLTPEDFTGNLLAYFPNDPEFLRAVISRAVSRQDLAWVEAALYSQIMLIRLNQPLAAGLMSWYNSSRDEVERFLFDFEKVGRLRHNIHSLKIYNLAVLLSSNKHLHELPERELSDIVLIIRRAGFIDDDKCYSRLEYGERMMKLVTSLEGIGVVAHEIAHNLLNRLGYSDPILTRKKGYEVYGEFFCDSFALAFLERIFSPSAAESFIKEFQMNECLKMLRENGWEGGTYEAIRAQIVAIRKVLTEKGIKVTWHDLLYAQTAMLQSADFFDSFSFPAYIELVLKQLSKTHGFTLRRMPKQPKPGKEKVRIISETDLKKMIVSPQPAPNTRLTPAPQIPFPQTLQRSI